MKAWVDCLFDAGAYLVRALFWLFAAACVLAVVVAFPLLGVIAAGIVVLLVALATGLYLCRRRG